MNRKKKIKGLKLSALLICLMMGVCGGGNALAWIGTGTGGGGSGSYGGGGALDCNTWSMWSYQIECAGASWAYYRAGSRTNSEVIFPWAHEDPLELGLNDSAKVPAECSQHDGRTGFWHYGPNNLGGVYFNNNNGTIYAGDGWVGHWATYSRSGYYGDYSSIKYSIPEISGKTRHSFSVYTLETFGSVSEVTNNYRLAWLYDQHKSGNTSAKLSDAPRSIPDDVWGFCYGDYMNEHTLTLKSILEDGTSISTLVADKKVTKTAGETASVKRGTVPSGYSFMGFRLTKKGDYVTSGNTNNENYVTGTSMPKTNFNVKSLNEDKVVYAVYAQDKYAGRSRVGPSTSNMPNISGGSNGISSGSAQTSYYRCTASCDAYIAHGLKRLSGLHNTKYTVTRTTNIPGVSSGEVASGTTDFSDGSWDRMRTSEKYTLTQEGQFVCETMVFVGITSGDVKGYTKACAMSSGSTGGGPEGGSDSGLSIEVRNEDIASYSNWSSSVYAKPKDNIEYRAIYSPAVQAFASETPAKMVINNGGTCTSAYDKFNTSSKASTMFNSPCGGGVWANGFRVMARVNSDNKHDYGFLSTPSGANRNYTYTVGSKDTQTETNKYQVQAGEAGRTLDEKAYTNGDGVRTVPKSAEWGERCLKGKAKDEKNNVIKDEDGNEVEIENCYPALLVDTSQMKAPQGIEYVQAKVPYNFINSTKMTSCSKEDMEKYGMSCKEVTGGDGDNKILYAGSEVKLDFDITTSQRENAVTDGTYATIVKDGQYRLGFCLGDDCNGDGVWQKSENHASDLNNNVTNYANINGSTVGKYINLNIPDAPAGTRMCVRSEVYPKDSGEDTNLEKNYYSIDDQNSWAVSTPVCFTIAKRPSMQVWGGNIYTNGTIGTATMTKKSLSGYRDYVSEGANGNYVFGSWGELGIIANGAIKGFASGASLGYGDNNGGTLIPNPLNNIDNNNPQASTPGGGSSSSICKLSPLTFANRSCSDGVVGTIGNSAATYSAVSNKADVARKYIYGDNTITGNKVELNTVMSGSVAKDGGVYYYHNANSVLRVGDETQKTLLNAGVIQVVHSGKDVVIEGDIAIDDGGAYETFGRLPKLMIYAGENIYIRCGVSRIDAILVAEKEVKTCAMNVNGTEQEPDVNSADRAHQLMINGTVIANKMTPSRTYGAATGGNSIVPAEIINFDPTLYRWGGGDSASSDDNNTNMDTTYIKELAPRK